MSKKVQQKEKKLVPKSQTEEWHKLRNERRRQRYAKDKEYRVHINKQNRLNYHERAKVELREAVSPSELKTIGQRRLIEETGAEAFCLTVEEIGIALGGYHKVNIYRWIMRDRFPKPVFTTGQATQKVGVYTLEQAKQLVTIFSQHQKTSTQLRVGHTDTIRKLMDAVS